MAKKFTDVEKLHATIVRKNRDKAKTQARKVARKVKYTVPVSS